MQPPKDPTPWPEILIAVVLANAAAWVPYFFFSGDYF
jgi:hypothetical protein